MAEDLFDSALVIKTLKGDFRYWLNYCDLMDVYEVMTIGQILIKFEVIGSVEQLVKNLNNFQVSDKASVFMFNKNMNHWNLIIIPPGDKSIAILIDSLGKSNQELKFLQCFKTFGFTLIDISKPQQFDSWNCSLYCFINIKAYTDWLKIDGKNLSKLGDSLKCFNNSADESVYFKWLRTDLCRKITKHKSHVSKK